MVNNIKLTFPFFLLLFASAISAETFEVYAGRSLIEFDQDAGLPTRWLICESNCSIEGIRHKQLIAPGDGEIRILSPQGPGGNFSSEIERTAKDVVVRFEAVYETRVYSISLETGRVLLELSPGSRVQIATGSEFLPEKLPGIGAIYSKVQLVRVNQQGQKIYPEDEINGSIQEISLSSDSWAGIRSRYWAWLFHSEDINMNVELGYLSSNRPFLEFIPNEVNKPLNLELYAGPVEWRDLKKVSPILNELLFAALWDFLRWICFGMLFLFEFLFSFVGNFGISIILLSLVVKIMMTPLTNLADRWQSEVNKIHSFLQPQLTSIKQNYEGEEAHKRILAVYKENNISQWYTLKSAAGFLIQIPIFIAAFDMLAESFLLNGVSFFWIIDLAKPDQLLELPFYIPFFGDWFNLLPFLMTALSLLASWLQHEDALTPELQRQQSIKLYLMSAAFFVLFYTFPAGMVLYWTASNFFHLIKIQTLPLVRKIL
ncbi:MAG: membrane protein insertase YidC [Pseudomonadota bacterium]|nr:membrane protein insertase YidC [Pseudomonadota bacterium]